MDKRTIRNEGRPAQPEPGEDEAVQAPAVREQAREAVPGAERAIRESEREERKRQTGE